MAIVTGPRGLVGPRGTEGKQGPPGRDGATGREGKQGVRGDRGLAGKQGLRGSPGPAGRSGVTSISVSSGSGLFGQINLEAGDNISLAQTGQTVIITSTASGGGSLTSTYVGFGDGSNLLTGSADFTYASNVLKLAAVDGSAISLAFTRAGGQIIEKQGTGFFAIGTVGAEELGFYTTNINRLVLSAAGTVTIENLGTPGGYVKAAPTTGLLSSVEAADVNQDLANDYDGWFKTQVDLMKAQVPDLTNFKDVQLGMYTLSEAVTSGVMDDRASAYDGGGFSPKNNEYAVISGPTHQLLNTGKWAFAVRAKLTMAVFGFIGFTAGASSDSLVGVAVESGFDATKILLYTWQTPTELQVATSISADTSLHDFVVTFDGTTIKLYIDGTLRATQTTLTYVTDGPRILGAYNVTHGNTDVVRMAYGYVAP